MSKIKLILGSIILISGVVNSAERAISIPGTSSGWVGSGVCFNKGDTMTIAASGSILHSSWDGNYHGPEGNPNSFCGSSCKPFTNRCNVAALVGKIGSSNVRCIGTAISGKVHNSGELIFGINDSPTGDNKGSFKVVIYVAELVAETLGKKY